MLHELFFQIGWVLIVAAAASMIVFRLRQPLMIGYILAGIFVGSIVFGFAKTTEAFQAMSEIGVAFLLFTVGLNLNWRKVKEVGGISLASGAGQVIFTTIIGYLIGLAVGLDGLTSFYLGLAFSFSSTIIIVKLLADKEDLGRLYGRIAVGFLIVQDIIAMIVLLSLGALGGGFEIQNIITLTFGRGIVALVVIWLLATRVVPYLVSYAARSLELLFLFSIGWCFAIAGFLHVLGFGVEIGALLAGVSLSGTIYHNEINARIRPLRDFFLIMFFIILGARLDFGTLGELWLPILAFSTFVLIGNPIVVMGIMRLLKYHPRTSFLTGNTVGQVSEFSFIVLAAGIALGHISPQMTSLAVYVALITIAGSAYLIKYNEYIYDYLHPLFHWLEPKDESLKGGDAKKRKAVHTSLIGYHRMGETILPEIKKLKHSFQIIDLDPQVIESLHDQKIPAIYGDAGDDAFLKEINIEKSKMIISTIPDVVISIDLLTYLHRRSYKGVVVVTCRTPSQARRCYDKGASFVIIPSVLGAERFGDILKKKKGSKRSWMSSLPKKV
jgi:Kef-type K+ transport system membrane component KefB/voltage-gated potassium channel Kch